MASLGKESLPLIRKLYYDDRKSMSQVADACGVSLNSIVSFMRRNSLARRSMVEQRRLRFEQGKPSFVLRTKLTPEDEVLKTMGVGLYWGEGYKSPKAARVDFANSDVSMVEVFLRFLREICGINESKLSIQLYCFANQDKDKLISFWSKKIRVPKSSFIKPYVRKDFRVEKIGKMPYGLVHIRYADKKLLLLIKEWIDEWRT